MVSIKGLLSGDKRAIAQTMSAVEDSGNTAVLEKMRGNPLGERAALIGRVEDTPGGRGLNTLDLRRPREGLASSLCRGLRGRFGLQPFFQDFLKLLFGEGLA